mgnify:CR=1 FL=1
MSSDTDKIGMMFELVLNRGPTEDERKRSADVLREAAEYAATAGVLLA